LSFQGTGRSDGLGLIIDNVRLSLKTTYQNYLLNGDFELPRATAKTNISTSIAGWTNNFIEVGPGSLYSFYFSTGANQVAQLYSSNLGNSKINQLVVLESKQYMVRFEWAATQAANYLNCGVKVYWNDLLMTMLTTNDTGLRRA
jgi:hypothetical protein